MRQMTNKSLHNQNQHFIPEFLQRMWGANGPIKSKDVFLVRREQFPKDPQPRMIVKKVSIEHNFSGDGLWSAARSRNPRIFEEYTGRIDTEASKVWKKFFIPGFSGKLTNNEFHVLFAFITSLLLRQPIILKENRIAVEKALVEFETNPRVQKTLKQKPQAVCARELAQQDGIHIADEALLKWAQMFTDPDIMEDYLLSEVLLFNTGRYNLIPLSDNPILRMTIENNLRITFCPMGPSQLLAVYRFLRPRLSFKSDYIVGLISEYISWAWRNPTRGVIIQSPHGIQEAFEHFSPKETFGIDYGSGTPMPANKFPFGAPFAQSLRL